MCSRLLALLQLLEVGDDVAHKIQSAVSASVISQPTGALKLHVDLWRAAESQLHDVGVLHIETARICTASNTQEWFSHRAEKGKTGRFGAVIELPDGSEMRGVPTVTVHA